MLNFVLTHGPDGWEVACQLGALHGVVAFLAAPLALVGLTSVVVCCLAMCAGPGCGDPRGVRRRGPSRFWIVAIVVCAIVLASRSAKDRVHTVVVEPRAAAPRHESLDEAVTRLEKQLDRASDRLDQQINHQAAQIDSQVDRGTAEMVHQLERTAAQIIRQLEHLAEQSARRQRKTVAQTTTVASAAEEPAAVVEPKAPALPTSASASPATPTAPATPAADTKSAAHDSGATAQASASSDSTGEQPEWTKTEVADEGNRKLVVVSGGFAGNEKDAQQEALEAARLVVGDAMQQAYPRVGSWLPPSAAVREDALRLTYVEKIHRKTVSSGTPFIVYRAYDQVELSPAVYAQLVSNWKEEVVPRRLMWLGSLAGLLTLTFATGAAYFRLDDRTHGRYRGRLRLAAATIIAAGAAVGFVAASALI
jgi:hypothetical protein